MVERSGYTTEKTVQALSQMMDESNESQLDGFLVLQCCSQEVWPTFA